MTDRDTIPGLTPEQDAMLDAPCLDPEYLRSRVDTLTSELSDARQGLEIMRQAIRDAAKDIAYLRTEVAYLQGWRSQIEMHLGRRFGA